MPGKHDCGGARAVVMDGSTHNLKNGTSRKIKGIEAKLT